MRHDDLRGQPSGRSPVGLSHCLGIATSRPPSSFVEVSVAGCLGRFEWCPHSTDLIPGPGTHIDKRL
jgi:hypothetical protein